MKRLYTIAFGLTAVTLLLNGGFVANAETKTSKIRSDAGVLFSKLGNVTAVKMIDWNVGWAVSNIGVFRTSDGGHKWNRVLHGDLSFQSNGQTAFINNDVAYVLLPITHSKSHLFVTHDGGRHWMRTTVDLGAQSAIQMSFINSHIGWVMTAPGGAAGPIEPVSIYKIVNGGSHVHLIVPAPIHSAESHGLPQSALKTGLYFGSLTVGWMTADTWGNDIWLYKTNDGGSTWTNHDITSIPTSLQHYLGGDQLPGNPKFFNSLHGVLPVEFTGGGFCLYVT